MTKLNEHRELSGRMDRDSFAEKYPDIESLLRQNRFGEARRLAEAAIVARPDHGAAYRMHYHCFMGLRDFGAAADAIAPAIALQPGNVFYRRLFALALVGAGSFEEAQSILEPMLEADPDNIKLLDALVVCYHRLGQTERAVECGQRKLALLDRASPRLSVPAAQFRTSAARISVVSFSLWGNAPQYCIGAMVNRRLVERLLPGWRARFYLGPGVPEAVIADLAAGAEIVRSEQIDASVPPAMRRYLVHDDPDVEHYLCRDADSRLTRREVVTVKEWLGSGLPFHIVRDHPFHHELILGGLWGGRANSAFSMRDSMQDFLGANRGDSRYGCDQAFLAAHVHPWARDRSMIHDSYYRLGPTHPVPGGFKGDDTMHIGMGIVGAELLAEEIERYKLPTP